MVEYFWDDHVFEVLFESRLAKHKVTNNPVIDRMQR